MRPSPCATRGKWQEAVVLNREILDLYPDDVDGVEPGWARRWRRRGRYSERGLRWGAAWRLRRPTALRARTWTAWRAWRTAPCGVGPACCAAGLPGRVGKSITRRLNRPAVMRMLGQVHNVPTRGPARGDGHTRLPCSTARAGSWGGWHPPARRAAHQAAGWRQQDTSPPVAFLHSRRHLRRGAGNVPVGEDERRRLLPPDGQRPSRPTSPTWTWASTRDVEFESMDKLAPLTDDGLGGDDARGRPAGVREAAALRARAPR